MKLLKLALLGPAVWASYSSISQNVQSIGKSLHRTSAQRLTEEQLDNSLNPSLATDEKTHTLKSTRSSLMPQNEGRCALHWSLCPNMCKVEYELKFKYEEIIGNKMKMYKNFKKEITEKRDAIVIDLKDKASQIFDWETEIGRNSLDLEKMEDAFLLEVSNDFNQADIVNGGLKGLKNAFQDLVIEYNELSVKISNAHNACEAMAPCMAVPICRLGAATGESCADIVNESMDKYDDGSDKNNAESGIYLIAPNNMEPRQVICHNDQLGGAYTVFQNRYNGSENFNRGWADYENGFGTAVHLNSPDCEVGEYWLGNKYIHAIQESKNGLRVDMTRATGERGMVTYSNFKVGDASTKYTLLKADGFRDDVCGVKVGNSLAGMNFGGQGYGNKDQSKTFHVGMKFSTFDNDNDRTRSVNCAKQDRSGWWFNNCSAANLNGWYHGGSYSASDTNTGEFDDGVLWNTWTNNKFEALVKTQMSMGQDRGFSPRECRGGYSGTNAAISASAEPATATDSYGGRGDYVTTAYYNYD